MSKILVNNSTKLVVYALDDDQSIDIQSNKTIVGAFEVVVHRCLWTALILLITTTFFKKWKSIKKVIS